MLFLSGPAHYLPHASQRIRDTDVWHEAGKR